MELGKIFWKTLRFLVGHPLATVPTKLYYTYPSKKKYSNQAKYLFEPPTNVEFCGPIVSHHHKLKDPLAFPNRHNRLFSASPDVFRRTKPGSELRCVTSSELNNSVTNLPHITRPRTRSSTPVTSRRKQVTKVTVSPIVGMNVESSSPETNNEFNITEDIEGTNNNTQLLNTLFISNEKLSPSPFDKSKRPRWARLSKNDIGFPEI